MSVSEFLRRLDIFEGVPDREINEIGDLFRQRTLSAGEVLCRPDELPHALFIVAEGHIQVDGADYYNGDVFLGDTIRGPADGPGLSATATATSRVLVIDHTHSDQLLAEHPRIMRNLLHAASRRALQANNRLLARSEASLPAANGRVHAVFSTRGGAGKTTLAVNLATRMAAQSPGSIALLDLDLLFDDSALLLELGPHSSLASIPREGLDELDRGRLNEIMVRSTNGLRVLVGATHPEEGELITQAHVVAALSAMKRQFIATIVDCGDGLGEATLAALAMADRVLVVCTPEIGAVRDVRECQRIFNRSLQMDKHKLYYVLNHPQPAKGLARQQVETALEEPIGLDVPHLGEAPVKAAGFTSAVDRLARVLEPVESPNPRKASGLLRFVRRS
jgi:Flp pilus assembly CpaE family ATPase